MLGFYSIGMICLLMSSPSFPEFIPSVPLYNPHLKTGKNDSIIDAAVKIPQCHKACEGGSLAMVKIIGFPYFIANIGSTTNAFILSGIKDVPA